MFKRKIYDEMLKWKQEYAPKYALFLRGARRVGKTTLAEKLGREEYRSYILVRFDQTEDSINRLFTDSLRDLDILFNTLQFAYNTRLYRRESLIILDEIQLFPQARQALKTLLEDGRYDYLETGSLATITKKSKNILIPSEEYSLDVLPMDYEEYLWANDNDMVIPTLREHLTSLKPMGGLHQYIMKSYREYMLVGGMPQVVSAFTESKDFEKVDFAKEQIINLYKQDMNDQEEENPEYVTSFFDRIPSELSKHDKRYVLTHLGPNARIRDYKGPIKWLNEAMIINIANNVDEPSAALNLSIIDPSFKCYLMDTGLLITLAYKDRPYLENELYKAILLDKLQVNEGMLLENMVAQNIRANGRRAYYYKETSRENKKTVMEIDFLIRDGNKLVPIEVKSGENRSIKSLTAFKEKYGKKVGRCIVLHHGEIRREDNILWLPYYMAAVI
ncbi:ATP-binding protein [Pseudobutyrivibrio sp.]|uniref:ATP-binding protein n=1 Tax=Pseudobutyrivibrio sp. TaxID=2014367 RepID=UPI0038673C1C